MNNIWCIFFIFALSILIFKSTYVKSSLIIGNGRIQTRVLLSWSDRSVNCATDTSGALKNVNLNTFFNNGPFPAALFFIFVFSIQLTVNWIRTADLWCRKRPLYQLSHNHFCPFQQIFPGHFYGSINYGKKFSCFGHWSLLVQTGFIILRNVKRKLVRQKEDHWRPP